jgi:hypothetical protein
MLFKVNMKTMLIGVVIALAAGLVFYRACRPGSNLHVDPQAREEIDKARRR